ncbi:hypothetical protein D1007_52481 [Hordeum vulgare]|nr:hypothetical protein D1007_52481 [Hordeum vulgare]
MVCDFCGGQGHIARGSSDSLQRLQFCRSSTRALATPPFALHLGVMPCLWDPTSCPTKGFVVMPSSSAVDANATMLSSLAMFIWFGGNMPKVSATAVVDAIHAQTNVKKALFKVVPHYPEDLFVTFKFMHHRDPLDYAPHGEGTSVSRMCRCRRGMKR